MMVCLICRQAALDDGFTSLSFEREEMKFIVHHVPAQMCPSCGEAYVNEEVGMRVLQIAGELSVLGIIEDAREYDANY